MRSVVDTNTLISGTLWTGSPSQMLDAVKAGKIILLQTPQLWLEFVEVLERPKFRARLQLLGLAPTVLADGLRKYVTWVSEGPVSRPTGLRDQKDLIVFAAAAGSRADAIVTGDKDLLLMKIFDDIPIMTAAEILSKL